MTTFDFHGASAQVSQEQVTFPASPEMERMFQRYADTLHSLPENGDPDVYVAEQLIKIFGGKLGGVNPTDEIVKSLPSSSQVHIPVPLGSETSPKVPVNGATESYTEFSGPGKGLVAGKRRRKPVAPPTEVLEKAHNGVMVGWWLPEELARELALDDVEVDGEPPEELHLTLVYLGNVEQFTPEQLDVLKQTVTQFAAKYSPLSGQIDGTGRFLASVSSDEKDVLILIVSVPRLEALREELVKALQEKGLEVFANHGYVPHITLAYVNSSTDDVELKLPEPIPVEIQSLTLAIGGAQEEIPLSGSETISKKQSDARGYRTSNIPGHSCSNCAHGGDGYCDQNKFSYGSGMICDAWSGMEKRYQSYTPTAEVQANARKALGAYRQIPLENRAPLDSSVLEQITALSNGNPIHESAIQMMDAFFQEHPTSTGLKSTDSIWLTFFGYGGRAGRSWAHRLTRKIGEIQKYQQMDEKLDEITLQAEVSKIDADKQQVFGWATVIEEGGKPVTDHQDDQMTPPELENMAYGFTLDCREAGVMHEKKTNIGKLIESMVFTKEKQDALGIDLGRVGWWIGFQITDPAVWQRVKSGELRAFSIHGYGLREQIE